MTAGHGVSHSSFVERLIVRAGRLLVFLVGGRSAIALLALAGVAHFPSHDDLDGESEAQQTFAIDGVAYE
jgi:hypothetical protein